MFPGAKQCLAIQSAHSPQYLTTKLSRYWWYLQEEYMPTVKALILLYTTPFCRKLTYAFIIFPCHYFVKINLFEQWHFQQKNSYFLEKNMKHINIMTKT